MKNWWIVYSPHNISASGGAVTGWTWLGTLTQTGTKRIDRAPMPGDTATGSLQAVNNDVPYDQFTIEQLAGDLLPNATPQQRLATAFHRQTLTNTEGGADSEEFRVEATFDRTETTATVWMGLTMTCASLPQPQVRPDFAARVLRIVFVVQLCE